MTGFFRGESDMGAAVYCKEFSIAIKFGTGIVRNAYFSLSKTSR